MSKSVIETIQGIAKKESKDYAKVIKFGKDFIEYTNGYFIVRMPYNIDRRARLYIRNDETYYLDYDNLEKKEVSYPNPEKIWAQKNDAKLHTLPLDFYTMVQNVKCTSKYSSRIFLSLNDAIITAIMPDDIEENKEKHFVSLSIIQNVVAILDSLPCHFPIECKIHNETVFFSTEAGIEIAFMTARKN